MTRRTAPKMGCHKTDALEARAKKLHINIVPVSQDPFFEPPISASDRETILKIECRHFPAVNGELERLAQKLQEKQYYLVDRMTEMPVPISSQLLASRLGSRAENALYCARLGSSVFRNPIQSKTALKAFYSSIYQRYLNAIDRSPASGLVVELGSGMGFFKEFFTEAILSDTLAYPHIDQVIDGQSLPFQDHSIRTLLLWNVFHHIPDSEAFIKEAERCLCEGGRLLIIEPHFGMLGQLLYNFIHHEPSDKSADWKFESNDPLQSANIAQSWIVFRRDRARFEKAFPNLRIERFEPHSPFVYWLAGGLKRWTLVGRWNLSFVLRLDRFVAKYFPTLCSFCDFELVKLKR